MGKGKMPHGFERVSSVPVDAGRLNFRKREKYCVRHGWIDVFAIGGDIAWQRQHGRCDTEISSGAAFQPQQVFKAAA